MQFCPMIESIFAINCNTQLHMADDRPLSNVISRIGNGDIERRETDRINKQTQQQQKMVCFKGDEWPSSGAHM